MKKQLALATLIFLAAFAFAQGPGLSAAPPDPKQSIAFLDGILRRVSLIITERGPQGLTRDDQVNVSYAVQTLQGVVEANAQYEKLLADGWQLVKGKESKP